MCGANFYVIPQVRAILNTAITVELQNIDSPY